MMKHYGFTMIEMLCTLAIMIILTSMVLPSIGKVLGRSKATAGVNWLIGVVYYARNEAVNRNVTTTLCPSSETDRICTGKWGEGIVVFADHNADARLNGKDYVIKRIQME